MPTTPGPVGWATSTPDATPTGVERTSLAALNGANERAWPTGHVRLRQAVGALLRDNTLPCPGQTQKDERGDYALAERCVLSETGAASLWPGRGEADENAAKGRGAIRPAIRRQLRTELRRCKDKGLSSYIIIFPGLLILIRGASQISALYKASSRSTTRFMARARAS